MGFWERYRPKPFWRSEYREAYLEQAGRNLLLAFVLSISLNPFYVLFFSNTDTLGYVVVENRFDDGYGKLYGQVYTPSQQEALNKYKVITQDEIARMKEFENKITWITITALLGWCVTSNRFMNGINRYIQRWKNE